ncbi:MAG: type II toxin-antitoxin system VapC family toxin [Pseudomonadota bacterium]|nr:type II toxin-antitoxin system VapC family toxin [Pseudomonadota bacterium]
MIGLDSNVLVRYLTQDDPAQSARATRLIERQLTERRQGFISLIVLVELWWVLKRLYRATAIELRQTLQDLLDTRQFAFEQRDAVIRALKKLDAGADDIADTLIVEAALAGACERIVTFDKRAVKAGMVLLK